MADDKHPPRVPLEDLHQAPQGGGGKGCLIRHPREEVGRVAGHHCSHQWMALKRVQGEDKALYNYPAYKRLVRGPGGASFATGARITASGIYPPNHTLDQARPRKGDWDVGRMGNFNHYLKPYWHNAHHLIPNRTLARSIDAASGGDSNIVYLIKAGLMMGEYNLNDKQNMMILPMGAAVSECLGLPRHLNGDQGGTPQFFGHPDYDLRIASLLKAVMDQYAAMVKKKSPDHDSPPTKLAKEQLTEISDIVHSAIKSLAKRARLFNHSLDSAFGTSS